MDGLQGFTGCGGGGALCTRAGWPQWKPLDIPYTCLPLVKLLVNFGRCLDNTRHLISGYQAD